MCEIKQTGDFETPEAALAGLGFSVTSIQKVLAGNLGYVAEYVSVSAFAVTLE